MSICNNRNIIITGAGAGLGRAYALALAAEGASVLVNDLRVDAAQSVVNEIQAKGGRAIANGDDITSMQGAEQILAAAVGAFGEVTGVVNNAGIVRDRMFASMSEQEWDDVVRVHLKGHFCITQLLVRRWREQVKSGQKVDARIINTSSGAGLQGNIGQSNYSAAKAGIAALTLVQAAELARYGITANALAPAARTQMTEGPFADMMKVPEDGSFDRFSPDNVAPLIVWLCSADSADVSGRVFEIEGGRVSVCDGWRTGPQKDKQARWQALELGQTIRELINESVPPQKVFGT